MRPSEVESNESTELSWQERVEKSKSGRVAIGLFVAVTLAAIAVVNLPTSNLRTDLSSLALPYANATGLDQGWAVFAPNPRSQSAFLSAVIVQRNGTTVVEPVPIEHGVSEYWDYRWQRFGESVLFDPTSTASWAPYCRWVSDQNKAAGGQPVRVVLMSRASVTSPPGAGPARGPWIDKAFYTLAVG